jgi:hypothetical protein
MYPAEQLIGDFWFIKARTSDQQAAVPDQVILRTPPDREETEAGLVCLHVLVREVAPGFGDGERCAALMLTEQFKIPGRVFLATQPQG